MRVSSRHEPRQEKALVRGQYFYRLAPTKYVFRQCGVDVNLGRISMLSLYS